MSLLDKIAAAITPLVDDCERTSSLTRALSIAWALDLHPDAQICLPASLLRERRRSGTG